MISFLGKIFTSIAVGISALFGVHAAKPELTPPVSTSTQDVTTAKPVTKSSSTSFQSPSENMLILDKNGEKTYFYKDSTHVWISGEVPPDPILIPDADPKTFVPIRWPYSKDANKVYYWTSSIPLADPATFRIINIADYSIMYAADQHHVFLQGKIVEGADPQTFKYDAATMSAEDKNHRYDSTGEIIQ